MNTFKRVCAVLGCASLIMMTAGVTGIVIEMIKKSPFMAWWEGLSGNVQMTAAGFALFMFVYFLEVIVYKLWRWK